MTLAFTPNISNIKTIGTSIQIPFMTVNVPHYVIDVLLVDRLHSPLYSSRNFCRLVTTGSFVSGSVC